MSSNVLQNLPTNAQRSPSQKTHDYAKVSMPLVIIVGSRLTPTDEPDHQRLESDSLKPLLAATARGERAAFNRLYQITSPKLYGIALHMLKRQDWAEEALQEAYLQIWQNAASYHDKKGVPMAWLVGIIRFRALDRLRRQPRKQQASDANFEDSLQTDDAALPLNQAIAHSDLQQLTECLSHLQAMPRECLLMAYYKGYVHSELAEHFERPIGTIKSWIRRGLSSLRKCLDHEENEIQTPCG